MRTRGLLQMASLLIIFGGIGRAQDPFEIHIYEYETLARGRYTLEAHLNFVGIGSKNSEGPVAPTNNQFHMTYELTAGITDQTSLGFMLLTGRRIHNELEYAGWRLLPHVYVPMSWGLPLDVGLLPSFHFSAQFTRKTPGASRFRPILEKRFGQLQLDLNPVLQRALHGHGTQAGWKFEPAGRIAYDATKQFTPSLEYYSELGSLPALAPVTGTGSRDSPGRRLETAR
jgi:hypothetical protein